MIRRFLTLLALSGALAMIGPAAASAQTGGAPAPGSTDTTAPAAPTPSGYSQVFPITSTASHYYGDGFGTSRGKRSHQGQDVFAPCGTMLVAVADARVIINGVQGAAGNYLVLRSKAMRQDFVYAHMVAKAPLSKGQIVTAGQYVGAVGDTGNASGCHLHFELWMGKYFRGGHAIDPLSSLQYWDAYS